ncbi:membrane metalloprotease [Flavobacterium sp. MDT1-60]|nr:membrane metalloprotease [Flavobacterium sp. MDT1-60]
MKKTFSLLTIILLFSMGACSKDDTTENSVALNTSANRQQTGSSANDLLSDKKFTSMVIEVVYVTGFEPSSTAINNFVNFLTARTYKPKGISIVKHAISSPGNSPYTDQEIVNIENTNRTKYNNSDQIVVWAFFADGKSSKDTQTSLILGTAYRNTSFVIFEQTIHDLSDSPFEPNRSLLETTIITHEFGHILGLTNLGTPLQSNHEDTEHPKHCIEKTCLMYWLSESNTGISDMLSAGTTLQLDAQCIADLRANGGR